MIPLEQNIRDIKKNKDILLVSHAVLGYPSWELDEQSVDVMIKNGVDVIELQIPFSDPQADGPFFTAANQQALDNKTSVEVCFQFADKMCQKYPQANFVFMTYFNILFKYGVREFVQRAAEIGVQGIIIPDLPLEESEEYVAACKDNDVAAIFMFTPTTTQERMVQIAKVATGFMYCQARAGVTGKQTQFDSSVGEYIKRCQAATDLPIAMGFGLKKKEDVDFLKGKVDLAICCTQAVKVLVEDGVEAMGEFVRNLR